MQHRPTGSPVAEVPAVERLLQRYLAAQLAGDRRAALRVVVDDGLGSGVAVPTLYLDVVQAAQHRIGELWPRVKRGLAEQGAPLPSWTRRVTRFGPASAPPGRAAATRRS